MCGIYTCALSLLYRTIQTLYYIPDMSLGVEDQWPIPSHYHRAWYTAGRGSAEPGQWKPGVYHVEILIDGVTFADGAFTIE
jgi:hypothetical protein